MNLSQLRAFDAVVRTGSFTAAAERLFVSQPAVTNHVKALEAYYEVSLFQRHGRGVEPTELGNRLAEISRQLFGMEEEATEILQAHKALRSGTLRIASDGPYVSIPLVKAFNARFPGVQISVTIGNTREVLAALLDERCDIAVQADPPDDDRLYTLNLARYQIIVFVSADHRWAVEERESIGIQELHRTPVIVRERGSTTRRVFEAGCQSAGVEPDYTIETTSRETVKEAVGAGLGVGVVAAPELRPDSRFHPLMVHDVDLGYTENIICLERRRGLRVVREFMSGAQSVDLDTTITP